MSTSLHGDARVRGIGAGRPQLLTSEDCKITSPSERVYIGQTTYFVTRQNAYKRLAEATEEVAKNMSAWQQPKLRNSLRKYGYEAHKIEIVLQCSVHDLDMYEIKFIALQVEEPKREDPRCRLRALVRRARCKKQLWGKLPKKEAAAMAFVSRILRELSFRVRGTKRYCVFEAKLWWSHTRTYGSLSTSRSGTNPETPPTTGFACTL